MSDSLQPQRTVACQASLSFTISQCLLKLMSAESVMPSNHLTFCHPLLFLLWILPSIRVFSNELALGIRWPKYWSFSFSISLMNIQDCFPWGLTGLISLLSQGLSGVFSSTVVRKHQYYFILQTMSVCSQSYLTLGDHMDCSPSRLLCPWNFPGKNTGVGCHFLLQGIFLTQGSNLHLLHLLHS